MKVIGNEITSLKIISAKAETTEIKLRTVLKRSKHKMALIKVIGNEKISKKNILAQAETAETTEIMLRTVSKYKTILIKPIGNEKNKLKIISAKTVTTEIKLRTVSKHEMNAIKVLCVHCTTFIKAISYFEPVLSLFSIVSVFAELIFKLVFSIPITFSRAI